MSENCQAKCPVNLNDLREAVCIHTDKITDSFRDKDYIEDLRVYLTKESQCALESATGARARYAELLFISLDVAAVPFHHGYYSVDLTYYYRILADALMGTARPVAIVGLSVFSKRIVMFGGDCGAKLFTSDSVPGCRDGCALVDRTCPEAVVEAVDPMILAAKLMDACCCRSDPQPQELPEGILNCFDDDLSLCGDCKRLYVSLGQFSVIRMQRDTQLLVPSFDYCVPTKECSDGTGSSEESDPAEVFNQVEFPVDSFFPLRGQSGC
ncbi:MAG: hypothetical protein VB055_00485 [Oscillospiraceae bacterium]|nr:hypothetical protein [Oscillospiraceae bacterium]